LKDCGTVILIAVTTLVLTSTPYVLSEAPEGGYRHWLALIPFAVFVLVWVLLIVRARKTLRGNQRAEHSALRGRA
jgi:hypothetical protein